MDAQFTHLVCKGLVAFLFVDDFPDSGSDNFAGTGFDQGEHAIRFLEDGKTILSVGESCVAAGFGRPPLRVGEIDPRTLASWSQVIVGGDY
ncbi:MAG: hypothetical protein ACYTG0_41600, partial [Planctomycetota bacterium]